MRNRSFGSCPPLFNVHVMVAKARRIGPQWVHVFRNVQTNSVPAYCFSSGTIINCLINFFPHINFKRSFGNCFFVKKPGGNDDDDFSKLVTSLILNQIIASNSSISCGQSFIRLVKLFMDIVTDYVSYIWILKRKKIINNVIHYLNVHTKISLNSIFFTIKGNRKEFNKQFMN
jgi:hypothetical protein